MKLKWIVQFLLMLHSFSEGKGNIFMMQEVTLVKKPKLGAHIRMNRRILILAEGAPFMTFIQYLFYFTVPCSVSCFYIENVYIFYIEHNKLTHNLNNWRMTFQSGA